MPIENIGGVVIIGLFLAFAGYSIYINWKRKDHSNEDDTGSK